MKISHSFILLFLLLSFPCVAQWKLANGPYGGLQRAILFKGTDVFVASSGGGVYRSSDLGATWKPVNKGLSNFTPGTLALNGSAIFAGTDGGGVFVSNNNGDLWTKVTTGITNQYVGGLATQASTNRIYAGTMGGVFVSTNNGTTWSNYSNGLTTMDVRSLVVCDTFILAATYGGGIFRSGITNNSWSAVNTGVTSNYIYSLAYSDSTLYAGSGNKGVFVSSSKGASWVASNLTLNGLNDDWVRCVSTFGTKVFAGTHSGVSMSNNRGVTWTTINTGLIYLDVLSLAFNGTQLFAGTNDGGVYVSQNTGTQWNLCGLQATSTISFTTVGNSVFAGVWGNYGVHVTNDLGNSWTPLYNGISNHVIRALTHLDSTLFAGSDGGGNLISHDFGKNWTPCDSGFPTQFFYCNALVTKSTKVYAGTNYGVFSTSNLGVSWVDISAGLINKSVNAIAFDSVKIYAGTGGGGFYSYNETTNTWTATNTGLTDLNIYSIYATPNAIFVGTAKGVFVSNNHGLNWTAVSNGLPNIYTYSIVGNSNRVFAGTGLGFYYSKDNGTSWTIDNTGIDGISGIDIRAMVISGNTLFASMYAGTLWTRGINNLLGLPKIFSTTQETISVYPNPMSATVNFDCRKFITRGDMAIVINDLNGNEVRRVCSTSSEILSINKEELQPGIYFYKIIVNNIELEKGKLFIQ